MKNILIIAVCSILYISATAQQRTNPNNQDEELGKVAWLRDYDTAISLSAKENKPVLILFQEVPGCATCRNYGHNVLSNPLMTEAIENEFIPLAIFNNKGGNDAKILKKYGEPSWNNPVVRIVDRNGDNLVKRVASDYSAKGLYNAMVSALQKEGKEIPEYVKILGKELSFTPSQLQERTYKMYCFWTGEKQLGSQEGVVETNAGFQHGEVVKVKFDPSEISAEKLDAYAVQHKMKPIKSGNFRWSEKDEDYYLQHSSYKYLPLSPLQRTKINSALGSRKRAEVYLSPTQKKWLKDINAIGKTVRFNKDFEANWNTLISVQ
ncbi:VPGUxxT family thioredoxin-like (seleno)protein, type 2 [Marinirhabdus gelatinilytica]|uniref:Thioredoxin-like protein n=1 Tax=Marinirhabdus gelatinilytica TaxID=1703343 RepID=A0A370QEV4_9FLAO|nr:VPGUxxT family thioredoxin-like (seleno)protein, type 2 [Marinirhabdus gelatinilytica]RDK86891.1 thioredoxin-like protein [Marinirhabdus gelatinilytica]